jgi:hypothetical protein
LPHAPDLLLCAKHLFIAAMRRRMWRGHDEVWDVFSPES